ncbi:FK506-binding protein 15 isoform X1 [Erythrolamprus reginae]|uniref:FK506-binding protein 15 isoform X1 n=1 Tax=Erythrolamprus reginae TaxID=121349 RepID=UPI00396C34D1
MFGGAEEEDADFVSPTGGARLASLFGIDQTASGTGNDFFQYTAPKQPKKNLPAAGVGPPTQKPPAPTGAPSVIVATAVHAYRFTNGTYVKQGKYGAAVVGCHATQEYRILLYINQQQQISSARIHPGFVFTTQPNNYGTFYDDQRQNWSLMFESEKAAVEFGKQLCLAKYNSNPSLDSVVCQDLILGDGPAVEVGDGLEVAFTGWLLHNSTLGQVFDSNVTKEKLLRLKLGSGKVIKGWEEGMMGLKKGGKRFLVVPPALAYGSQGVANRVPPDSTLAFEVEVKRVRLAKEAASNGQNVVHRDSLEPSPGPSAEHLSPDPAGLPPSTLPPKPGEPPLRAKSNSLSEQLANPDVAKAKLISRMAKMGQPMLPFLSGSVLGQLDSSDSEIEDPNTLREAMHPVTSSPLKPSSPAALPQITAQGPQVSAPGLHVSSATVIPTAVHPPPAVPGSTQSLQAYTAMNYAYPQAPAAASQLQPLGAIFPTPFQAGDIGSFLMTEARQQNTEIRLSVGKVADKIDQLTTKVEELQKQNSTQSLLPGISSITMETSMIMTNIQRIVQENERLKQEVFEKSGRIEEQNEKISELIQRNQRYVEQSNLFMEQRNNSLQMNTEHSQARVLHAEQEKRCLSPSRKSLLIGSDAAGSRFGGNRKSIKEAASPCRASRYSLNRHFTLLSCHLFSELNKSTDCSNPVSGSTSLATNERKNFACNMDKIQIGQAPELFDAEKMTWDEYMATFEIFLEAAGMQDAGADRRRAIFLNYCGAEIRRLAQTLTEPEQARATAWDVLQQKLASHFKPTRPAVVYRHQFHMMAQRETESISQFTTRLRTVLAQCKFQDPEARLTDALIFGMKNHTVRSKLLTEDEPTLQTVIKLAQTAEAADAAARELKEHGRRETIAKIDAESPSAMGTDVRGQLTSNGDDCLLLQDQPRHPRATHPAPCAGCRGNHQRHRCPFRDTTCRRCNRRGHIAIACRATAPEETFATQQYQRPQNHPPQSRERRPFRNSGQRNYPTANRDYNRGNSQYSVNNTATKKGAKIVISLLLNNQPCSMELDTGSRYTIMPWEKFKLYMPNVSEADLIQTSLVIRDFQGGVISVLGTANVPIVFKNVKCTLPMLIVTGAKHSLLGLAWMEPLGIEISGVYNVNCDIMPNFVKEFPEVFSPTLGLYKGTPISFSIDPKVPPVRLKPRRVPLPLLPKLDLQLDKLISQGILVPVEQGPWETPIVTPLKPDGSLRVCADYKSTLNKALQHHPYPIPVVQQLLHSLGEGKRFAKIDLAQAYQQLPVDEQTANAQTIVTHRGAFKCTRLQFGVSIAPGIFQSIMERLLSGVNGAIPYFDDILIAGENQEQVNKRIREVLKRLQDKGLRIKPDKCVWGTNSIEFLGYKIDKEGIHPTTEKLRAIREAPEPRDKSELQAFLGLLNFYSVFLKQKATVAEPLHRLLQKEARWTWGKIEREAFAQIKNLLTSKSVVVQYSASLPIRLTCDASPYGIGGVLAHVLPNQTEAPIAFFSRTMTSTERNYSQLDKEALALVAGVKKFHNYIFGRNFELVTDHKPLLGLLAPNKPTPPFMSPRLIRWALFLSGYQYELTHKGGKEINHADGLSRCPIADLVEDPVPTTDVLMIELEENPLTTAKEVAAHTQQDQILKQVVNCVLKGWQNDIVKPELCDFKNKRLELSYVKGCLLWGDRVIIPKRLREKVLRMLHVGHPGIVRMKSLARGHLWWPGLDADIESWVSKCDPCQESRPNPPKTTPAEWEQPAGPWSRIHIDFAGPVGSQYFLIVVDAFSKWLEIIAMNNITTSATIKVLSRLFASHGCPDLLVSDNGPQLTARQFELFLDGLGVRHALISPYSPWANGLAERYVRVAKEALHRSGPGDVQQNLDQFLLTQHITPNSHTHVSPAELLMGRKLRSPLDRLNPRFCLNNNQMCIKPEREMYLGQNVYVKCFDGNVNWMKGIIVKQNAPKTYIVKLEDGRLWKRHIDHIRKRTENQLQQPADSDSPPSTDFYTLPELRNTQRDLSGQGEPSSDAEPSSSSEAFVGPARPSPPHRENSGEPSSTVSGEGENGLRRSARESRRPHRLDDFVTWLS